MVRLKGYQGGQKQSYGIKYIGIYDSIDDNVLFAKSSASSSKEKTETDAKSTILVKSSAGTMLSLELDDPDDLDGDLLATPVKGTSTLFSYDKAKFEGVKKAALGRQHDFFF